MEPAQPDLSRLRIQREQAEPVPAERRTRWKLMIPAAAVLLLAVLLLLFRSVIFPPPPVDLVSVTLTFPSQANALLTANGYVVAQQKAAVASKGTGRLEYHGVEEGDKVRRGTVIARLENKDVLASLERARADLAVARSDGTDAKNNLDRTQRLYAARLASNADLDAAQARYDRVQATILSAGATVREAEVALENTLIRAPFDGTVLTKDANVGEVVAPFGAAANSRGAVVTMADMSSLQVEADVSEANITKVTSHQPCEIVLDAYPAKAYHGFVHKIVPTADRSKATVTTKVAFTDKDDQVLPEMSAKVTFLAPGSDTAVAAPPVLTVASAAVVERGGRSVVFLYRDGKAVETPVTTGGQLGSGRMEVVRGLAQGEQVILNPRADLATGEAVQPRSK
ncbi:MAG TPA: efflux RND transporter periplasmic adaptor subunit [Bacteroidota bacterium]